MTLTRLISALSLAAALLSGCRKDASDVFIIARPATVSFNEVFDEAGVLISSELGFPGGKDVYFDIEAQSIHSPLVQLTCESFSASEGSDVFCRQELSSREYIGAVSFRTPAVSAVTTLKFIFTAIDTEGYSGTFRTDVKVFPSGESVLEELAAVTLYSAAAGSPDAFSFSTLQPLVSTEDAEKADMVISQSEGVWSMSSLTDVVFVPSASFDYPAATADNISSVFKASLRQKTVTGLKEDDVILVGRSGEDASLRALGVMKLVAISGNRAVLSIKHIK